MKTRTRVISVLASALLALGLAACGSAAPDAPPEEVAVYAVEVQQPFVGREARDGDEILPFVDDAVKLIEGRQADMPGDAEETELSKKVNSKFNKANDAYREGNYEEAQKGYEEVIKTYPLHYGANVNLALALLQQEKNEEALTQALACIELSPSEGALLLNVQAAGVACGFSTSDIEMGLEELMKKLGRYAYEGGSGREGDYEQFYAYNKIWDRIETELHDAAAQPAEGDEEASDESEETERKPVVSSWLPYDNLSDELTELEGDLPDDSDVAALHAYLYAVGLQLGYEADPSLFEPMHRFPFIAVDSDICTIEATSMEQNDDGWLISFDITNKTAMDSFSIGRGKTWIVNDQEVSPKLDQVTIEPGSTQGVMLALVDEGGAVEGDATSFAGTLAVTSKEQNTLLAIYPISWKAEEVEAEAE